MNAIEIPNVNWNFPGFDGSIKIKYTKAYSPIF